MTHNNGGGQNVDTGYGPATGRWEHVAVVFDGTDRELFVNGVSRGSYATTGGGVTDDGDDPLWFGGMDYHGQYFKGSLDDIRIYNEALSASEVAALAAVAAPAVPLTHYRAKVLGDEPVMYWSFDEAGSSNAIEQVGGKTADQLLPTNGAVRASHASLGSGLYLGNAASFDGANDCFAAADLSPTSVLPGAYAIEFWMQKEPGSSYDYLVNFQTTGDNHPAVLIPRVRRRKCHAMFATRRD